MIPKHTKARQGRCPDCGFTAIRTGKSICGNTFLHYEVICGNKECLLTFEQHLDLTFTHQSGQHGVGWRITPGEKLLDMTASEKLKAQE